MAKTAIFGKRENEKKKQTRRLEKQKRKEERKQSSKPSSLEDMIAYVDENGRITSTPPGMNGKKEEIDPENIRISTPRREEEPVIWKGRVEYLDEQKGFGFIKDLAGTDKYFFHMSNVTGEIGVNNLVVFDLERGKRGMNAVNICLWNKPTV